MSEARTKGDRLEAAVKGIEEAILRSSPALQENAFLIECKKIVTVQEVRHEIDVWVETDLGAGYRSVFIFECKNWDAAKVGKNDVIVISEKIKAVRAQRGYLVAKGFTADAVAQAKTDGRLELLVAREHDPESVPIPFGFHHIVNEIQHIDLEAGARGGGGGSAGRPLLLDKASWTHRGATVDARQFIDELAREAVQERSRTIPSGTMSSGLYEYKAEKTWKYKRRELAIQRTSIAQLTVTVTFSCRVLRPPIVSRFDVEARGRYYEFAPVVIPGIGVANCHIVETAGLKGGGLASG